MLTTRSTDAQEEGAYRLPDGVVHVAVTPRHVPGIEIPGSANLSLQPIVRVWEKMALGTGVTSAHASRMLKAWKAAPALHGIIYDLRVLDDHRELVDDLLSVVLPPALRETQCAAALAAFRTDPVLMTSHFARVLGMDSFVHDENMPEPHRSYKRLTPYLLVLERVYALKVLPVREPNFVFPHRCAETGLDEYYQVRLNLDFVDVVPEVDPVPPLSEDLRQRLLEQPLNLELMQEAVPAGRFRFEGLIFYDAVAVTLQENLVALRQELLSHESVVKSERLKRVEHRLASLLRLPRLVMRVGMFAGDQVYFTTSDRTQTFTGPCTSVAQLLDSECAGQIIRKRTAVVLDLTVLGMAGPGPLRDLYEQGFRTVLRAPLESDGAVVGLLELASTAPNDFNAAAQAALGGVLPMLGLAVKRALDTLDVKVQAVIKELFTAIHPSIEWRFRLAATAHIRGGEVGSVEPIVFENVFPLFGVSDIRSSSTLRSHAIRDDLLQQLELMAKVLDAVYAERGMPYVNNLRYRLGRKIEKIAPGLSSGDEVTIIDFLRYEIEPLLARFDEIAPSAREAIRVYRSALDAEAGIVYRRRRDFEDSVAAISDSVARMLDERQDDVQRVFPHYFEMHKTDGVDHSMYVGASMSESLAFDMLYLRNLRLWQLLTMCEIARRTEAIRGTLAMPLETAHLVLVQNTPLTIRFSLDEKQFTVDGAYNIRYEIMKKRLDKATVGGTGERLTQPRQLAIVYSQTREAEEYQGYLTYLQSAGYIDGAVEDLLLDELPGVNGLRALRVAVKMD